MSYRIFELPLALCPGSQPAIQLLCSRDKVSTAIGQLFLGKNFAFSGSPPDSYDLLQTFTRFAWHGKLTADYPADTLCIDTRIGVNLQLDGPDLILEDVADFDAIGGKYWLIIDDELMFLANPTLTGVGAYALHTVRGQYGTPIQPHAAGADVYIIRAEDCAPVAFNSLIAGNVGQFKVTLGVQQASDQVATETGFVGGAHTIAPASLVAVNNITTQPIIPVNTNFTVSWQLPALNGFLASQTVLQTLLEIITPTTTYSMKVTAPTATAAIVWANLPADAACGFTLRLTTQVDGGEQIISGAPVSLNVLVAGPGLAGFFYNDPIGSAVGLFTEPVVYARVDATIDVDFAGSPGGPVQSEYFSARYKGWLITTANAGAYQFSCDYDDGIRLRIGGTLVIDDWTEGPKTNNGTITLRANCRYPVILEYFQFTTTDYIHLSWQPPTVGAPAIIPSTNLATA
ncbi:MAG: PA14 domain-containing protein [Verrucomicrobiae bacterium]|nr:PA14 domain-containing protein [Verrucomicrobiae bacterium]